jgi:hypothetical protein
MMHTGKSRDGELLYPAMPFASYTKVTRADSDAIYAYLLSTPPIHQPNHAHELRFPFNQRSLLYGWRMLYMKPGEYQPDTTQSVEWNRGAPVHRSPRPFGLISGFAASTLRYR